MSIPETTGGESVLFRVQRILEKHNATLAGASPSQIETPADDIEAPAATAEANRETSEPSEEDAAATATAAAVGEGMAFEYHRSELLTEDELRQPEPVSEPAFGDMLLLEDSSVVLYRQAVPEKECDFIYLLRPGAALEVRGIDVRQFGPRWLGRLEDRLFRHMARKKKWDRDALVAHLQHWSLSRFIPISRNGFLRSKHGFLQSEHGLLRSEHGTVKTAAPRVRAVSDAPQASEGQEESPEIPPDRDAGLEAVVPPAGKTNGTVRRGATISIKRGDSIWTAVYWGSDSNGSIVAHNTVGKEGWALIRLNLERFGDAVAYGPPLSADEIDAIAKHVVASY